MTEYTIIAKTIEDLENNECHNFYPNNRKEVFEMAKDLTDDKDYLTIKILETTVYNIKDSKGD